MNFMERLGAAVGIILAYVPRLIGAIIVLLVGYLIAKVIQSLAKRLLSALQLDQRLRLSDLGQAVHRITPTPSRLISRIAFWAVMLITLPIAASTLNIPALTGGLAYVYAYVPNLIAAALILGAASIFSALVATAVNRAMGETPTGRVAKAAIPAIAMTIAAFMALNQLGIARDIVNITFTALIGSVALGMALAFGLGGREVAKEVLEEAYARGRESVSQVRQDLAFAREQAEQVAPQPESEESFESTPAEAPGRFEPAFGETLTPEDMEEPRE